MIQLLQRGIRLGGAADPYPQLIASLTVGFTTSLALAQKNGVELDKMMGILRSSALYAPQFDKKMNMWQSREYGTANFPLKHLLKDVRLFATEARKSDIDDTLLNAMEKTIKDCVDRGYQDADYSAIYESVFDPKKK